MQARTGRARHSRSCVRYAPGSAPAIPALALAVALPALFRAEIPAIALATLFPPRPLTAQLAAVALTAEASLAHAEHTATPEATPPEQLDQVFAPRHVRKAVDRRGGSWDPWGGPMDQGRSPTRRGSCPGRVPPRPGHFASPQSRAGQSPPSPPTRLRRGVCRYLPLRGQRDRTQLSSYSPPVLPVPSARCRCVSQGRWYSCPTERTQGLPTGLRCSFPPSRPASG